MSTAYAPDGDHRGLAHRRSDVSLARRGARPRPAHGLLRAAPLSRERGALTAIGALLTTRMPEHPISWGFAATALLWAVGSLAYAYAFEALVADPGSLPGGRVAAWLDNWLWLPGLALPLSLLSPPRAGRPPALPALVAGPWPPLLGGTALASAAVAGSPTFELGATEPIENPLALDPTVIAPRRRGRVRARCRRARRVARVLRPALPTLARRRAPAAALGRRLARPRRLSRRDSARFTWGVFPGARSSTRSRLLALPVGIAVAVLKYRLYEIDLVVNRALVYGAMTICRGRELCAVVGLVGATLSDRRQPRALARVTGVVAVCFQPLRERVQRFVNRLMYGERDDPYAALARLGRRLESSLGADAVLPTAVETIGQTLRLQYVALALAGSDDIAAVLRQPSAAARFAVPARASGHRRRRAPARTESRASSCVRPTAA